MRAVYINDFGPIESLKVGELPIPIPKENEVQIEIAYAGVNPADWKACEGLFKSRMAYEFPIILGWEASGRISALGKNATQFKKGDEVFAYCRKTIIRDGTFAEYICVDASVVAYKPKNFSFAQAASVPLTTLTAWQSLFDAGQLKAKQKILIHGGGGGVGGFAIQLAKQKGAHVITTASAANHSYVKKLGADFAIDYRNENFVDKVKSLEPKGLDFVLDTIGGDVLKSSYGVVKPGGHLISIAATIDQALAKEHNINAQFVFVAPNGKQLTQIAELCEKGKLIPPEIQELPLEQAIVALRKIREGHTRGKMVLKVKQL